MAAIDNTTIKELPGAPGMRFVRGQLTGTTSTYTSPYGASTGGVLFSVEGTNATTMTWVTTTGVITITGTDDDYINIWMWSKQ